MSFSLPKDANGIVYLGNLDSNNNVALPTEQYIAVGNPKIYLPVSTTNPLPGSKYGNTIGNQTSLSVAAATNILTSSYSAASCQESTLMLMTDTVGTLSLLVDGVSGLLNNGVTLATGQWYTFKIPLASGSTYNIQFSVGATLQIKWVAGI